MKIPPALTVKINESGANVEPPVVLFRHQSWQRSNEYFSEL